MTATETRTIGQILLDDLIEAAKQMGRYQDKHGMETAVFFDKYNGGELPREGDFADWHATYRDFLRLYVEVRKIWDASEESEESPD